MYRFINLIKTKFFLSALTQKQLTFLTPNGLPKMVKDNIMKINGVELETLNQIRNDNTINTEFKYDI